MACQSSTKCREHSMADWLDDRDWYFRYQRMELEEALSKLERAKEKESPHATESSKADLEQKLKNHRQWLADIEFMQNVIAAEQQQQQSTTVVPRAATSHPPVQSPLPSLDKS